jgi:hypothetical protein
MCPTRAGRARSADIAHTRNNRICELFGIEFQILAFTHCRDVATAVTNAGAMGVLGASAITPSSSTSTGGGLREQVGD